MMKDSILINGSSYVTFNDRGMSELSALFLLNKCVFIICSKHDSRLIYKVKRTLLDALIRFTIKVLINPPKSVKFNVSYLTNLSHFKNLLFDFKSSNGKDYIQFLDIDSKKEEKIFYSELYNVYLGSMYEVRKKSNKYYKKYEFKNYTNNIRAILKHVVKEEHGKRVSYIDIIYYVPVI